MPRTARRMSSSEAVESENYFRKVLRYIHQNPVKAGLVKDPAAYLWSSHNDYIQGVGITDREMGTALLGSEYETFMSVVNSDACIDFDDNIRLTDQELAKKINDLLKIPAATISGLPDSERRMLLRRALTIKGATTRQLARVTGVQVNVIWTLNKKSG